jgi:hypothetical protein
VHRTTARSALPIPRAIVAIGLLCLVALAAMLVPGAAGRAAPDASTPPPSTTVAPPSTVPPVTANEFLPENADLTTCIGAVERPGCGNENRGGWHQLLVFGVLALAMAIVFTRITIGVRRSRRRAEADEQPDSEHTSA